MPCSMLENEVFDTTDDFEREGRDVIVYVAMPDTLVENSAEEDKTADTDAPAEAVACDDEVRKSVAYDEAEVPKEAAGVEDKSAVGELDLSGDEDV
jgi:hypothetical protein